ncbi:MAG: 2TM domain-containing protein [Acidobacteria bacterium]|nr:2TM domain-containing protein [Acidobacteriota bacterium]
MLFRRNPLSPLFGFVKHLTVFLIVNLFLLLLNLVTGGEWWFPQVLFGWGIGLLFHAVAAGLAFFSRLVRLGR